MALADMQGGLKSTLMEIANASDQLASAAEELSAVTDESSRGLTRQNDEIQQAATAVNQMTAAVDEVASNAVSTSQASRQAATEAEDGQPGPVAPGHVLQCTGQQVPALSSLCGVGPVSCKAHRNSPEPCLTQARTCR